MRNFLVWWELTGVALDMLLLLQCYLMRSGRVGEVLKTHYYSLHRFRGEIFGVVLSCAIGFVFPPYILAGLIYFIYRVKQERNRLREYGRL